MRRGKLCNHKGRLVHLLQKQRKKTHRNESWSTVISLQRGEDSCIIKIPENITAITAITTKTTTSIILLKNFTNALLGFFLFFDCLSFFLEAVLFTAILFFLKFLFFTEFFNSRSFLLLEQYVLPKNLIFHQDFHTLVKYIPLF